MFVLDAWCFFNNQNEKYTKNKEWFMPRNILGIVVKDPVFPLQINAKLKASENCINKDVVILKKENESYQVHEYLGLTIVEIFLEEKLNADIVNVLLNVNNIQTSFTTEFIKLSGNITDFNNKNFCSPVILFKKGFFGNMGVWSDENGFYSLKVPKGHYSAIYVDDDSYGQSTLENWSYNMNFDKDTTLDFKIGNSEVYNFSAFIVSGHITTLNLYFREMTFSEPKMKNDKITGKQIADVTPIFNIDDIVVYVNGIKEDILRLEKVIENSAKDILMPASLVTSSCNGIDISKEYQDVTIEYFNEKFCSQGRTQFKI